MNKRGQLSHLLGIIRSDEALDVGTQAGVHPRTAYRWFHAGLLPVPARQLATGTILVDPPTRDAGAVAAYARVSSADQRADLDRQVARLAHDTAAAGLAPLRVVTEVGSALNGNRPSCGDSWPTRTWPRSSWSTPTGCRASAWSTSRRR